MDYDYPGMEEAQQAWPIVRQAITGTADKAEAVQAGYVLLGCGLSIYPGEPGGFGAKDVAALEAAPGYSRENMVTDLDNALALSGNEAARAAIPWATILPILLAILQGWMKK